MSEIPDHVQLPTLPVLEAEAITASFLVVQFCLRFSWFIQLGFVARGVKLANKKLRIRIYYSTNSVKVGFNGSEFLREKKNYQKNSGKYLKLK